MEIAARIGMFVWTNHVATVDHAPQQITFNLFAHVHLSSLDLHAKPVTYYILTE